jgi:hypothetical protein
VAADNQRSFASQAPMTSSFFPPPLTHAEELNPLLQRQGYAVLTASQVSQMAGVPQDSLLAWRPLWNDLPPDAYLRDGGRYRRRRHSCFVIHPDRSEQVPHRPHWQPLEYNALHGGLERHFEPMDNAMLAQPAWGQLLVWLGQVCSALKGAQPWFAEAHQFRIDTTDGIGRPTPEGAHRDGVDLVAVFLVERSGVKGGETRVFDAQGPNGQRFTLSEPWSLLLLDDARVIHESTPIQPLQPDAHRDTLVLTLRAHKFQSEA